MRGREATMPSGLSEGDLGHDISPWKFPAIGQEGV